MGKRFAGLGMGNDVSASKGKYTVTARVEHDADMGPPWEEHDGHGPVSEWTRRAKRPGERILCEDRGSKRYYDVQEAIEIAKRDGWDAPPYGEGTKGQKAARAVEADYQNLRDWCRDEWCWVGVVLSVSRNGHVLDEHAASCWGIESNAGDYLAEVAREMFDEAIEAGKAALEAITK